MKDFNPNKWFMRERLDKPRFSFWDMTPLLKVPPVEVWDMTPLLKVPPVEVWDEELESIEPLRLKSRSSRELGDVFPIDGNRISSIAMDEIHLLDEFFEEQSKKFFPVRAIDGKEYYVFTTDKKLEKKYWETFFENDRGTEMFRRAIDVHRDYLEASLPREYGYVRQWCGHPMTYVNQFKAYDKMNKLIREVR